MLAVLAPDGPVYQAGTLSGNPLATAAGLAVLDVLDEESYAALAGRVAAFAAELDSALNDGLAARTGEDGTPAFVVQVPVVGPLFGVYFTSAGSPAVRDFGGAEAAAATGLYGRFFQALLRRGVAMAPGPYEVAFPSLAHGEAELERTLGAAAEAAAELVL